MNYLIDNDRYALIQRTIVHSALNIAYIINYSLLYK